MITEQSLRRIILILVILLAESFRAEPQQVPAPPANFNYDGYKSACCHTECCCSTCPQGCPNPPPSTNQQQMVPMNGNNRQGDPANGLMHSLSWGSNCICETNAAFTCKVRDPNQPTSYQGPVYPPLPPPLPPGPTSYSVQPPLPPVPPPGYVQPVPPPYQQNPSGYITPINGSGYGPSYAQPIPPPYPSPPYLPPQYAQQPPGYLSKLKGQILLSKDCTCEMSRTSYCRPVEPCPTEIPYYTSTPISPNNCLQSDFGSIISILGWLAVLALMAALIWALWSKNRDKNQRVAPVQSRVVPGLPRTRFDNRMSAGDETVDYRQY